MSKPKKMEWILDELPETNKDVIVALNDDTILLGVWKNDTITRGHHWEIYWQDGLKHIAPSLRHVVAWMHLPELPKL